MPNTTIDYVKNGSDGSILSTGYPILVNKGSYTRLHDLQPSYITAIKTALTTDGIANPFMTGFVVPLDGGGSAISDTNPPIGIVSIWVKDLYDLKDTDASFINKFSAFTIERNQKYSMKLSSKLLVITQGQPVYVVPSTGLVTNAISGNYLIPNAFFQTPEDTRVSSSITYPCPEGDGSLCAQVLFNGA